MRLTRFCILVLWLLSASAMSMASRCDAVVMRDSMSIHFLVSKWELLHDFSGNAAQLDSIRDLFTTLRGDSLYRISHISIIGGASPEGSVSFNQILSLNRANTLFSYLKQYGVADMDMDFTYLGRDWQGVLALAIDDPNLPAKNETLALLKKICDEKERNYGGEPKWSLTSLKSLQGGRPYLYLLKNIFPKVRASKVILEYSLIPMVEVGFSESSETSEFSEFSEFSELPEFSEFPELSEDSVPSCKPFYLNVRSNLLYDALLLPNIGVEYYLGKNFSIGGNWMYGWWSDAAKFFYWRAYGGEITGRWWFGRKAHEKPLTGHHIGVYGQMYTYDFQLSAEGEMGGKPGGSLWDQFMWGAGLEYGYSMPVGRRINIDFSLGVGYTTGLYNEYKHIDDCNVWQRTKRRRYVGPSKLEISFVWLFGCDNYNRPRQKGGEL